MRGIDCYSMADLSIKNYEINGAFVIPGFVSAQEVAGMKNRMAELVSEWDPAESKGSVFVTTEEQHIRTAFFLDSADSIRFFLEAGAVDEEGNVRASVKKEEAINKAGHGLHVKDDIFKAYAFSPKVVNLVTSLGYKAAVLPQSMYIFKQPKIGGTVTSHQDSTFLFTEPRLTCLGLWLALDDADLVNGCLWVRPGSHKEPLRRRFVTTSDGNPTRFVDIAPDESKWEGKMPGNGRIEDLKKAGFIYVPVKAGDLVGIHGSVDHLSLPNTSNKGRHSFQLHLVEGPDNGVYWGKENWLQYKDHKPFPRLV